MSATCVVPALFKLFLTKGHRGLASVVLDVIALAMQCSVFFIATIYLTREGVAIEDVAVLIQTTASLVLISLRYWENFIDRDIGAVCIQSVKARLRMGRCKTYIFASLWKIGLTFAFVYILIPDMTPMADIFRLLGNETVYSNNMNGTSQMGDQIDFTMKFPNGVTLRTEPREDNITYDTIANGRYQVPTIPMIPTIPTPGTSSLLFRFHIIRYIINGFAWVVVYPH